MIMVSMLCLLAHPVQGQFWKKWFGSREDKAGKSEMAEESEEERRSATPSDAMIFRYPESQKRDRYRIDLLLPLYLDELVSGDRPQFRGRVPDKASSSLEFYQGAKLAADSLNRLGFALDLYVQDIASVATSIDKLLASQGMDTSSLILGLVQSSQIDPLARFGKEREINFISALSPSDASVKENPFFTMIQPTLQTHCEVLVERMEKRHRKGSPILAYRTSKPVDKEAYGYLKSAMPKNTRSIQVNEVPDSTQFGAMLDPEQINVIVVGVMDPLYAEKLLYSWSQSFPGYDFEIYGMPSWKGMNSLRQADAYANLAVHITTPFYYDPSTRMAADLAVHYQEQFGGMPSEWVYRGFELLFWYGQQLVKYGTVFNPRIQGRQASPITGFDLRLKSEPSGTVQYVENRKLFLIRYQGSAYTVE